MGVLSPVLLTGGDGTEKLTAVHREAWLVGEGPGQPLPRFRPGVCVRRPADADGTLRQALCVTRDEQLGADRECAARHPRTVDCGLYCSDMASMRSDAQKLNLFVERVERAVDRRAVKEKTIRAHFSVDANAEHAAFTADSGDEEDLRSLLLDFRSFLAPQEDVHAYRIFNILELRLTDDELKRAARENREDWKKILAGRARAVVNSRAYSAEDAFNLIINGDLFHMDVQKAEEYAGLPQPIRLMLQTQMVQLVIYGLGVLWATRNIIIETRNRGALSE